MLPNDAEGQLNYLLGAYQDLIIDRDVTTIESHACYNGIKSQLRNVSELKNSSDAITYMNKIDALFDGVINGFVESANQSQNDYLEYYERAYQEYKSTENYVSGKKPNWENNISTLNAFKAIFSRFNRHLPSSSPLINKFRSQQRTTIQKIQRHVQQLQQKEQSERDRQTQIEVDERRLAEQQAKEQRRATQERIDNEHQQRILALNAQARQAEAEQQEQVEIAFSQAQAEEHIVKMQLEAEEKQVAEDKEKDREEAQRAREEREKERDHEREMAIIANETARENRLRDEARSKIIDATKAQDMQSIESLLKGLQGNGEG